MPEGISLKIHAQNLTKQAFAEIQKSLDKTTAHFEKLAQESQQTSKGLVGSLNRLKGALQANQEGFQAVAIGAGAVAAATGLLTKEFIGAAMTMQKMKMGLVAVMGSSEDAEKQLVRLKEVAKLPGLGLQEAIQGAVRLQVVGTSAEDAAKQLTAFGGAVARAGGGRGELARVVEQIAQMSAKGKVLTEDFRPIVSLMPDIMTAMDKAFGTKQIDQIREMGINSQQFIAGITTELLKMPGVGQTAANSVENLSDTLFELKASLGEALLPTVSKVIDTVAKVVSWFNKLSDTQKSVIAWGTAVTAGLATLAAAGAGILMMLPSLITGITTLSTVVIPKLSASLVFLAANPIALAIAGIAALGIGIALLIKAHRDAQITSEKFANALEDIGKRNSAVQNVQNLSTEVETLRGKTSKTTEESQRLVQVQNQLAELVPRLVKGYDAEGNAIIAQTDAIKKYIIEQEKLIAREIELLQIKSRKRLPELEEDITKASEKLSKMEATLRETDIGKRITYGAKAGASFWEARIVTYDEFLNLTKKQNEKVQALITERRDMEVQLEISRGPKAGPPAPSYPPLKEAKPVMGVSSKITDKIMAWNRKRREEMARDAARLAKEETKKELDIRIEFSDKYAGYILKQQVKTAQEGIRQKYETLEKERQAEEDEYDFKIRLAEGIQKVEEQTNQEMLTSAKRFLAEQQKFEEQNAKTRKLIEKGVSEAMVAEYEYRLRQHDYYTNKKIEISDKEVEAFYNIVVEMKRQEDERERDIENFVNRASSIFAELPFNMAEAFITGKQTVSDAIKNFFTDIGQLILRETQKIIATQVAQKIMQSQTITSLFGTTASTGGAASAVGGLASAGGGILSGIAPLALPALMGGIVLRDLFKGGFDNPRHDAIARSAGFMYGASFDNPKNDLRAQLRGTMTASQELGERSAQDMVTHFSKGFEQGASGKTSDNNQLENVLRKIEGRLSETPQLRVYLGDREITATVRREMDKQTTRGVAY